MVSLQDKRWVIRSIDFYTQGWNFAPVIVVIVVMYVYVVTYSIFVYKNHIPVYRSNL